MSTPSSPRVPPHIPLHSPLHIIDLIRKKRDGGSLDEREIGFLVSGAADGSIPPEQLSAWLMAAFLRGLDARRNARADPGHARLGREVFARATR
jgi:hypothetical protein